MVPAYTVVLLVHELVKMVHCEFGMIASLNEQDEPVKQRGNALPATQNVENALY